MGFGKFVKKAAKGVGKVARKGVKLAAASGLLPAGGVAAVVASKLQTAGEKRRQLKQAAQGKLVQSNATLKQTAGAKAEPLPWQKKAPPLKAATTIRIAGGAKELLTTDAMRRKSATAARLEATASLDAKIAKLSLSQRQDLADQFKREGGGSPAQFKQFLAANL